MLNTYLVAFGACAVIVAALFAVNAYLDRRQARQFEADAAGNCGKCFNRGTAEIISGFFATCPRCLGLAATPAGRTHLGDMMTLERHLNVASAARLEFDDLTRLIACV